jgi:hypothetical protein
LKAIPTGGTGVPRIEIRTTKVGEDSPEGYAHLTSYRIDLVSSAGTTEIATSMEPAYEHDLLDVSVPGYLPLRGNRRVAVLVLEERRGWEGSPHVRGLHFVGADLSDAER